MSLASKIAIVTGAASGIGLATARRFASEGAKVAIWDLNAEGAQRAAGELSASGAEAIASRVDVADRAQIEAALAKVHETFGPVQILVNNAGITDFRPFMEMTEEVWDRVMTINLKSVMFCTQAVLPDMLAARWGRIINISSSSAQTGSARMTAYAASKGGVIAFTKSLAREVARYSINVNCICPGPTDTPMLQSRPEKLKETFLRAIPFRRFAKPQEIADAIAFFASSHSDYITGQVMSVSGGLTFAG
jgi:2-hydroxycyclohexanecarboxyl-CoA dehydrogenase